MKGRFVTFEGIEGSGKSTVIEAVGEWMRECGIEVILTRDPGGTRISESIREILLNPGSSEMFPTAELFLYLASRSQLVNEVIRPALKKGKTVLCDRFMDASVAYQGWARGIGERHVEMLNSFAVGKTRPDLTFLLDLSVRDGFSRGPEKREDRGIRKRDRMERENVEFHLKVREGYLKIAKRERDRVVVIDASRSADDVIAEVIRNLKHRFNVDKI